MNARQPIAIAAVVGDSERPAFVAGAEQLSQALSAAAGDALWPVHLGFSAVGSIPPSFAPAAIVVSLGPEADRIDEPVANVEARWRNDLVTLRGFGAQVFVCTVFRHIQNRSGTERAPVLLERIRRLNRMAADLSHDLDLGVIDIDRTFAHIGGQTLSTDYRLGGALAATIAGHAIAWSLLSFGLDEMIDPALQEKAKAVLGKPENIDVLMKRGLVKRAVEPISGPRSRG